MTHYVNNNTPVDRGGEEPTPAPALAIVVFVYFVYNE